MTKQFNKAKLDKRAQKIYEALADLRLSEEELWEAVKITWEIEMISLGYDVRE